MILDFAVLAAKTPGVPFGAPGFFDFKAPGDHLSCVIAWVAVAVQLGDGQNPMGLIQQLSGQNAPIMQGLNLIQGKNETQLRTMAQNLAKERGIDLNQLASVLNLTLPR